jgi:ParB family protein of integrating conjugative element (PFGI_1 class)
MSKKQPTQEELASKVFVGNFASDDAQRSSLSPQEGDALILNPGQLTPYDRNPRRVRNREYESIKEQLLTQGLQEVMAVTQRPGMPPDRFIPARGFNTRLQIILEIFEETADERFAQIKCRYKVWESEAKTFTNHMAENEVRGEVTFFDRASSVMTLKAILEEETGDQYGPTELIDYLKNQGIRKVSRKDIARFQYTLVHLQESLVETLSLGLGPWQVDAISKLHKASSQLWEDAGETEDWDPLFQGILSRLDKRVERLENWSYDRLFKEVARELGGNDTQGIERALANLEFVLETGRLPEKREYTTATPTTGSDAGGSTPPASKPAKPRVGSKPASPTKPTAGGGAPTEDEPRPTPVHTTGSGQSQGIEDDLLFLEEAEEDPDDALIDPNDPLFQGLAPDSDLSDLVEGEGGSLHYQPDHRRYEETPGALEANLAVARRWQEERKHKPLEPLPPELQEIADRRREWEAELERNKVETGRSRATEIRLARLIENFRPLDHEVLHHHGYASALRIGRETLSDEAMIQPLNRGAGFFVSDWPRDLDFENAPGVALPRLAAWYWLVTASGQIAVHQAEQLPDEILSSPFAEIIIKALDSEGNIITERMLTELDARLSIGPNILILQELMRAGSLNLSIDQAILNRVNQEIYRRCLEQFDRIYPGVMFQLESRWDRVYSDFQIDRNDYL